MLISCSSKPFEKEIIGYFADKEEEVYSAIKNSLDLYIKTESQAIDSEFNLDSSSNFERVKQLKKNDLKKGIESENSIVSKLSKALEDRTSYYRITAKYRTHKQGPLLIEKFSIIQYQDSVAFDLIDD